MCLILKTKKEIPIPKAFLAHVCDRNDDGWGLMWIENNELKTQKSVAGFEALWNAYQECKEFDPVIHTRMKTHGNIDQDNAHPYYCGHGIYLMHNGIVSVHTQRDATKSDTWHLVKEFLKPLFDSVRNPHEFMRTAAFRDIFEERIGFNNRMILGDRGGFVTFNEKTWHTITNEKTECVGMVVSNQYAWDTSYGQPKNYGYQGGSQSHPTNTGGSRTVPAYSLDAEITLQDGNKMYQIMGNIYEDDDAQVWSFNVNDGRFQRQKQLDGYVGTAKQLAGPKVVYIPPGISGRSLTRLLKRKKKLEKKGKQPSFWNQQPSEDDLNKFLNVVDRASVTGQIQVPPFDDIPDSIVSNISTLQNLTEEEYISTVIKTWQNESVDGIESLVYSEPEVAAKVIRTLMDKHA